MCFQTQLVLEFTRNDAYWNQRILDEVRGYAAFHHASAFDRHQWPVITAEDPELVQLMQCGLVPKQMSDAASFLKQYSTYNAKSEEIYAKRTFTKAAQEGRRCLIPVTGFYEWMHIGKQKFPHFIFKRGGGIFHLGGLYENGTYAILTTIANERMAQIHNSKMRMPVIIPEGAERKWLDRSLAQDEVLELCRPAPEDLLEDRPVSRLISTRGADTNVPGVWAEFDHPELRKDLDRTEPAPIPTETLF